MNSKLLAGSVMSTGGVLGAIANAWATHFFFTMFYIARAQSLESAGSFSPGRYASPEETTVSLGIRVLLWAVIAVGVALMAWGVYDELREEMAVSAPEGET